jgi:hypothetical protein
MKKNIIFTLSFVIISGCSTSIKKRQLSAQEMKQYNLNGIIHEAKICPMIFVGSSESLKVNGKCETVSCELEGKKTICWAQPVE